MNKNIHKPYFLNEVAFNEICRAKEDLIRNKDIIFEKNSLRQDVAESWIRSLNFDLKPKMRIPICILDEIKFRNVFESNRPLIDVAKSVVERFRIYNIFRHYTVVLHDANYISLFLEGDGHLRTIKEDMIGIGQDFSEQYFGTSALLPATKYGPVQLIGPEHYFYSMRNDISTCAPIYNSNNELVAYLALIIDSGKDIWSKETHLLQESTFGWTLSMAFAIEKYYHLHTVNMELTKMNDTLENILNFIDEGVVMLDTSGFIVKLNEVAKELLEAKEVDINNKNFFNYFKKFPQLPEMVLKGLNFSCVEGKIETPSGYKTYLFSSQPIIDEKGKNFVGSIVRINTLSQIRPYVISQGASTLKFVFDSIIGESKSIEDAKKRAHLIAPLRENILIYGASGTGKEMFAQSIHNASGVVGNFVALNCAALPRNLVESELFGYEGGAFTGAKRKGKIGKIEMANFGTLFLDEIADMPLDIQAIFLRVLEDKHVTRLGGTCSTPVNFRLLSATNKDLLELVRKKLFREDLYYRISTLCLHIPPLCKRENDVEVLARHFIEEFCLKMKREPIKLSKCANTLLNSYSWPGNVRQLEKAIVSACIFCKNSIIKAVDFPEEINNNFICDEVKQEEKILSLEEMEKYQIKKALYAANNNVAEAASLLKIGQSTLYTKLTRYGLRTLDPSK